MKMQQWVNVMRKAWCDISYVLVGLDLVYVAKNKKGDTIGVWIPKDNRGSVILNNELIMSWEFTQ